MDGRMGMMSSLGTDHLALLERLLAADFVPHLLPLLDATKPVEEQRRKNLSRAFSAFSISRLCDISAADAATSVVDDFDDNGVDLIFYHARTETLYMLQAKLKKSEQFTQDEALAFCQGIRKILKQDFTGFNQHVLNRSVEIEDALDTCTRIQLVVAHVGSGVSAHAKAALEELISNERDGEERLRSFIDYDAQRVMADLQAGQAYKPVHASLDVYRCAGLQEPRVTYFGLVKLADLVKLHQVHGKALYEKNIRTFLGHETPVNASIQKTLAATPEDFFYLNNGVTALCQEINPKSTKGIRKRLQIRGLSVINGAQTIASAAALVAAEQNADIAPAKVSITLIKASTDGEFGKLVTRARNHQNVVSLADFAALDDEQERLRRDIAYLSIHYVYKPEATEDSKDPNRIRLEEAAHGLALLQTDPRFVVWLKREPGQLLDTGAPQYRSLFDQGLTAFARTRRSRTTRSTA
ncbi:MAG: AIPR family protein [Candidatus Binataceae bacterium]